MLENISVIAVFLLICMCGEDLQHNFQPKYDCFFLFVCFMFFNVNCRAKYPFVLLAGIVKNGQTRTSSANYNHENKNLNTIITLKGHREKQIVLCSLLKPHIAASYILVIFK